MTIAIVVAVIAFTDLIVVTTLIRSFVAPVRELAKEFPATAPAPDAVRREFQSFKFGMVNAGWGVHPAVDDRFLHLYPARLVRMVGMTALSVPWEKVRLVKRGRRMTRVMIEGKQKLELSGPTWCLVLAGSAT